MTRPSVAARLSAALAFTGALVMLSSATPGVTLARARHVAGPGEIVLPAGQGIHGEHEPDVALPYAPIADLDAAGNQHEYALQAAALPSDHPGLAWKNVGPFGQDDPTDYPTGNVRFSRAAGMGSTIAVDPRDPTGSSVYVGNMGGLWHSTDGGTKWRSLSDGKLTRGAVGAIGIDPNDPESLYVGTGIGYLTTSGDAPGSGIWVSHDAGTTFTRPAKNIKGYATNEITVADDGTVYAATSNGLYASTDDGASFTRVVLPSNAAHDGEAKGAYANWISAVAISPIDHNEVIAAVGLGVGKRPGPDGPLSVGNGLYKSENGPAGPWVYMPGNAGLTNPSASTDPIGRVMLSWTKAASGDGTVLWALVSDAELAYGGSKGSDVGGEVSGTTGEIVNPTNTQLNGLYRSDNAGGSWVNKATPDTLATSPNQGLGVYPALGYGIGVQAYYNLWVEADPRNPDQVYLGLEEVYQSVANTGSDPGPGQFEIIQRYWDVCGSTTYLENIFTGQSCPDETPYYGGTSTHPDQHWGALVQTGDNTVRLYTANDGGFFRQDSHDIGGGRNQFDNDAWTQMNTLATVEPYKVARKPDGEYLTALQDNGGGFFKPGETGVLVSSGDGVNAVATSDPDTWYLSAQGAIIYVTQDHGKTIRAIPSGVTGATFLSPFAVDPTDENHLVVAGRAVMESLKGPDTTSVIDPVAYTLVTTDWTQSFDAGTNPDTNIAYQSQAIAVRGDATYVAMCGLCRNTLGDPEDVDGSVATNVKPGCTPKKGAADCWDVKAGKGLPHNGIWNLAIDPTDVETVYVVLNNNSHIGYDPKVGGTQRVMVSHDAGASFTDITGNLPRSQARDVVVRGDKLIVATDNGVFTAPKAGKTWSRLGGGLPPVRVFDLDLDPTGQYLTASVYGRGVWNLDFKAKASSSAGPGPNGEPTKPVAKPRGPAGPGTGGIAATGANATVAVIAALLLAIAVTTRRLTAP
jgi:hypothetical protein